MDKRTQNSDFLSPKLGTSSDAINRVFNLELIHEKILDYAIHEKGIVETSNVKSYRLVSKAWHQSTSRVLRKSMEPLFKFRLGNDEEEGEELNYFVKSVTEGVRLEDHVPPHSIDVYLDDAKFYQRLFECFVNCGSGLIELTQVLDDIPNELDYNTLTTNVSFQKLRKLDITIVGRNQLGLIEFLQRILTSSEQMQSLVLLVNSFWLKYKLDFGNLRLPPSIKDIEIPSPSDSLIEMLVQNSLPNLNSLSFFKCSCWTFDKEGIFTRLLQNVCKNLERFLVYPDVHTGRVRGSPTTFVLPLMEKLQIFLISNMNLELEGYPSSLERYLPVLNELQLHAQTVAMLRKWVDTSCFHSVTSLSLSFRIDLELGDANSDYVGSSTMRALKSAFPNLRNLGIELPTLNLQDSALTILWEMKNLTSLRLSIDDYSLISTPDLIDALLIGISLEDVPKLRKYGIFSLSDISSGNLPSIRNLTNLKKLALFKIPYYISDETFEFAFFEMPMLKLLYLPGLVASKYVKNSLRQNRREHCGVRLRSFDRWNDSETESDSSDTETESDSSDTETESDSSDTKTESDSSNTETESRSVLGFSINDLPDVDCD